MTWQPIATAPKDGTEVDILISGVIAAQNYNTKNFTIRAKWSNYKKSWIDIEVGSADGSWSNDFILGWRRVAPTSTGANHMTKPKSLEQRRTRAAKSLGLIPVRMWATMLMAQDINRMRNYTDAMIEAELKRKHSNNGDEK